MQILEARPAHTPPVVRLSHQNLRVPVHTGNQSQTDRPPDGLRHLALVARTETGVLAVLDPAHLCHILRHDAEVLYNHCQHSIHANFHFPTPACNLPRHTL